jgi:hypothetical protein
VAVGLLVAVGETVAGRGVGLCVGVGVGVAVRVGVRVDVGVGVGVRLGVAVGVRVAVGVGAGVQVALGGKSAVGLLGAEASAMPSVALGKELDVAAPVAVRSGVAVSVFWVDTWVDAKTGGFGGRSTGRRMRSKAMINAPAAATIGMMSRRGRRGFAGAPGAAMAGGAELARLPTAALYRGQSRQLFPRQVLAWYENSIGNGRFSV